MSGIPLRDYILGNEAIYFRFNQASACVWHSTLTSLLPFSLAERGFNQASACVWHSTPGPVKKSRRTRGGTFQSGISLCLAFHFSNGIQPAQVYEVSIRHQPVSGIPHFEVESLHDKSFDTFQSGISLCLAFHRRRPRSTSRP